MMARLFLSVLNMSLTASYVILFVMLIRLLLKKAPKAISYVLWVVVGLRLVFPFSFESLFSLIPFGAQPIPQTVALGERVPLTSALSTAVEPIADAANGTLGTVTIPLVSTTSGQAISTGAYHPQAWLLFGSYLWLIGLIAMLLYSAVSTSLLKRQLRSAVPTEGNVYEASNLRTPFVLGLIKPRIYLPVGLSPEERRYILRHEQTHIRRGDHLVKLLAFAVLSLHWFNPLVWCAFRLMSTDMELSCDEQVIRELGTEIRQPYAASLLSLAAGRHLISGSPLAFGEGNATDRIKNVLNYKPPQRWLVVAAIVAVTAVGVGLLVNPLRSMPLLAEEYQPDEIAFVTFSGPQGDQRASITLRERDGEYGWEQLTSFLELLKVVRRPISPSRVGSRDNTYQIVIYRRKGSGDELYPLAINFSADLQRVWIDNQIKPSYTYRLTDPVASGTYIPAFFDWFKPKVVPPGDEMYSIIDIGTGGGGQGLTPFVPQQTMLTPTSAPWSLDQSLGVGMVELDYASDDRVIFHGYFGLFVYDLNTRQIIRSLDLKPLDCTATQGDNYCDVTVSSDGNTVQLHRMSSKMMYVYNVADNTLYETAYVPMRDRIGLLSQFPHARTGFVPIEQVIDTTRLGVYSYNAVRFDTGEYGYLRTSDWTLRTLTYVRGDKLFQLFNE